MVYISKTKHPISVCRFIPTLFIMKIKTCLFIILTAIYNLIIILCLIISRIILTLIYMAYFWPIFTQGITQLLMVGFSKFFFCLKDLEKFLLKIDDRTS